MENMNNRNNNDNGGNKGFFKHGLMMMLCCLLPVLLIAGLPLLGIKGGTGLGSLVFLLCPLMHIGMMFMMRGSNKGGSCHGGGKDNAPADTE